MSDVACPNCRGVMSSPSELSGKWVACPFCHQQFVLPNEKQVIIAPSYSAPAVAGGYSLQSAAGGYVAPPMERTVQDMLSGIRTPILISAIFNTIGAVIYTAFCITIFIAIPLAILCIFEYCYYSNSVRMPTHQAVREGRTIGIFEIVTGALTLNVIVLTCGILALVNANQAQDRLLRSPATY